MILAFQNQADGTDSRHHNLANSAQCTLGCFIISSLSIFLTAALLSDGIFDVDYEFDIIFLI